MPKKEWSEYLSSGETGRSYIVVLAKQTKSSDIRATRMPLPEFLKQQVHWMGHWTILIVMKAPLQEQVHHTTPSLFCFKMFHLTWWNHKGRVRSPQDFLPLRAEQQWSLDLVSCQKLIRMRAMKEHGEISAKYKVVETPAIYFTRQYSLSNFGQFTDGLYRRNHKYCYRSLYYNTALQISLTPLRQLIQIIFCGFCNRMMHENGCVPGQAAHLWIAISILPLQFYPCPSLSCYNIWCNSHNNNQLSGYLWCIVGRRRCVLSCCGNLASEAKWV